jgi:hypothetical protein
MLKKYIKKTILLAILFLLSGLAPSNAGELIPWTNLNPITSNLPLSNNKPPITSITSSKLSSSELRKARLEIYSKYIATRKEIYKKYLESKLSLKTIHNNKVANMNSKYKAQEALYQKNKQLTLSDNLTSKHFLAISKEQSSYNLSSRNLWESYLGEIIKIKEVRDSSYLLL